MLEILIVLLSVLVVVKTVINTPEHIEEIIEEHTHAPMNHTGVIYIYPKVSFSRNPHTPTTREHVEPTSPQRGVSRVPLAKYHAKEWVENDREYRRVRTLLTS